MTCRILFLCSSGFLVGCASIERNHLAIDVDLQSNQVLQGSPSRMDITADLNGTLSSEYFGYFELNFRNPTDRWLSMHNVKVSFENDFQNANTQVVTGKNLAVWYRAQSKTVMIDQYNKDLGLAVIAGLGAGLAATSRDKTIQGIGLATLAGATAVSGVSAIQSAQAEVQNIPMVPENHLLADTIIVPPGLFVDKWILFNSGNHDRMEYITALYIEFLDETGQRRKKKLSFREKNSWEASIWQHSIYSQNLKTDSVSNQHLFR